jgi:hypothetical protein
VSVEVPHAALTVPSAPIQLGPEGIFAWALAEGDVVQARPITSEPTTGAEGERVVVTGQYKLRQSSKVTVTLPAQAVGNEARAS